jgi:hypothetical protein
MPMTATEIAKRLRALADEITVGAVAASVQRPAQPAQPAQGNTLNLGLGTLVGVAFWDVKQKKNGDPYARLKTMDGDVYTVWDVPLLHRLDPLMRGDNLQITFKVRENKERGTTERDILTAVKVGGQHRSPAPQGIGDDDIPF